MAGRNLRAVLLTKPGVNRFLAGQIVERLSAKPLPPVTMTFTTVTSYTGTTKVFRYGQATQHFGNDVVKRGATGSKLLVAVRATVITS